jgi:Tfp pilus assembly protein PilE
MPTKNSGYTLVELMVSISLALFVSTLIFSAYTHLFKGIRLQNRRADAVGEMVSARRAIVRALDSIETVTLLSSDRIMFENKGSSENHTLEFHDDTVFKDGQEIVTKLKSFTLTANDTKTPDGKKLIQWECTLSGGGWSGGSFTAQDTAVSF